MRIDLREMIVAKEIAHPHEKGFTLVEAMIAVVVLSVGLFAAASMQIKAVDVNSSADRYTDAVNIAQAVLERLLTLEYDRFVIDPELLDDAQMAVSHEPFTDTNGNSAWDMDEPYTDSNGNGVWDAAHTDTNPPPGYAVSWRVEDNLPVNNAKYIMVYVTPYETMKPVTLSCVKSRE
ncbi:hypothetical protein PITCH_A130008 [uncultured Desulfobacterium sp.]|uniref:Prepilin-type N-terminal cleavage/methylation domain-containing protein n=1 Tax=uncultured Desulfobacterium sp. TaxID=201089 RepID=A0A445MSB9_9BACT|nr:hypothetical protein PITCH_A130008 [uncultured Desulfobacterium sp.]